MWTQHLINLVAVRQMYFQVELRLGIRQLFPRFADLPRLLFALPSAGSAHHDRRRLQAVPSAKNTVPQVVCSDHRESNRFSALFCHGKCLRKQMLLDAAKKLVGIKFLFAGSGTPQETHEQHNQVTETWLHSIQHISQVVHVEVIADRNQYVAGSRANRFWSEFAFQFEIELIHFYVRHSCVATAALRNREDYVQQHQKPAARHGRNRFREQVDKSDQKQRQRNQSKAQRNLFPAYREIKRHLEFALARIRIAQNQHCQPVHRETPDHAE